MTTLTIPKSLTKKGDLVVISRREYEVLLKRRWMTPAVQLTASEKKALDRAREEMARGESVTLRELEYELASAHSKKREKKS